MIPGELYFMIKIPTSAFFISKGGGKKTGAILHKYTHFFFKTIQREVILAAKKCKAQMFKIDQIPQTC